MDWSNVMTAVATLGGVAFVFGVLIALAQRHFHVYEDPRLEAVTELLPGSNCGACGFAGCRAFAEGLVTGGAQPAGCTQLGADDVAEVAEFLGVEAGVANKRVARLLCAGGHHTALQRAEYRGLKTCAAAATIASGGKACTWGCLGLADCEVSCDYDAITMNVFGLPVVDTARCTACNDCVEACPKDLFELMPVTQHLLVQCKSALEGDGAEELCKVACTACGKCAVDAAPGLIEMKDGLAVIDYTKNDQAGPEATARCPTGAIVWVDDMQFAGEGK